MARIEHFLLTELMALLTLHGMLQRLDRRDGFPGRTIIFYSLGVYEV